MARNVLQSGGVRFEWFIDRPNVLRHVDNKVRRVLARTGGFGKTVIRRSIRPPKKSKKARSVVVDGRTFIAPAGGNRGKVIDAATGRPATTVQAREARNALRQRLRKEGVGKPPRRGPTDLLRRFILFGVDPDTERVVIGALPFRKQPRLSGVKTVPELLEKGGGEYIGNELVKYQPRQFVQPALDTTLAKMGDLIEQERL